MSAFVCSRRHIAAVARAARHFRIVGLTPPGCVEVKLNTRVAADILMTENVRSVDHRYREENQPEARFTFAEIQAAPDLTPDELLKAVACLEYQSCETDDWQETAAFALLMLLTDAAVKAGASKESPAYDRAPWGIPEFGDTTPRRQRLMAEAS